MNCSKCGTRNPEEALHCLRCGTKLVSLSEADTFAGISTPPLPPSETPTLPGIPRPSGSSSFNSITTAGPWAGAAAAPAMARDTVDFGPRYRIERMLGQGGMGAVYKAYDKELDRTVALKLVRPDLAAEPQAMARFKQELLLASKISHKNILRIHDLGEAAGVKFISMAYVHGQDLHGLLQKGRLSQEQALAITRQLCSALEAAHAEGVVHRDLKPQNVLLDEQQNVFVTDFGLAKSLESDTGMTMTGQYLGTPRYMAPEQVEGRHVDHRADLYALGLILYEMLTGDVPFHADTPLQLMYKRVHEVPRDPRAVNPAVPEWLSRIVLKAINKDPEQRYQSAREILNDLDAARAPSAAAPAAGHETRQISFQVPVLSGRAKVIFGGLALAVALALASLAVPAVRHRVFGRTSSAQAAQGPSKFLALLPLRTADTSDAYLADGINDALYAKFYGLSDVQVANPSAVQKVNLSLPSDRIAHSLGVKLLVSGSVQRAGDRLRVIINLDDASQNRRLLTQEFSGVDQDLLTLEDRIFSKLFNAVEGKDTAESLARASAHPTENFAAYEQYLKGRDAMRIQVDPKSLEKAIGFYDAALKQDPNFALAYTGLADAGLRLFKTTKDVSWAQRALSAAQQAQNLSPTLPEVHFALGSAYIATGRTAEAIAELRRAVELAPTADDGYRRLGDAYRANASKDDALAAYNKAIALNPYYWFNYNALGSAYLHFGDMQHAVEAFTKVTELEPQNAAGYRNLGIAYCQVGQWDRCISAFQKSLEFDKNAFTYSNLGTAYFYEKKYDDAAKMFEQAVALSPNDALLLGNLADSYRWSGHASEAVTTYDKALALDYKALAVNPKDAITMGYMAQYLSRKGDQAKAYDFIQRARAIDPKDVNLIYFEAQVNAAANKIPQALQSLEEALRKGYSAREASNDPELEKLQSRQEFAALVRKYSAP